MGITTNQLADWQCHLSSHAAIMGSNTESIICFHVEHWTTAIFEKETSSAYHHFNKPCTATHSNKLMISLCTSPSQTNIIIIAFNWPSKVKQALSVEQETFSLSFSPLICTVREWRPPLWLNCNRLDYFCIQGGSAFEKCLSVPLKYIYCATVSTHSTWCTGNSTHSELPAHL